MLGCHIVFPLSWWNYVVDNVIEENEAFDIFCLQSATDGAPIQSSVMMILAGIRNRMVKNGVKYFDFLKIKTKAQTTAGKENGCKKQIGFPQSLIVRL